MEAVQVFSGWKRKALFVKNNGRLYSEDKEPNNGNTSRLFILTRPTLHQKDKVSFRIQPLTIFQGFLLIPLNVMSEGKCTDHKQKASIEVFSPALFQASSVDLNLPETHVEELKLVFRCRRDDDEIIVKKNETKQTNSEV